MKYLLSLVLLITCTSSFCQQGTLIIGLVDRDHAYLAADSRASFVENDTMFGYVDGISKMSIVRKFAFATFGQGSIGNQTWGSLFGEF